MNNEQWMAPPMHFGSSLHQSLTVSDLHVRGLMIQELERRKLEAMHQMSEQKLIFPFGGTTAIDPGLATDPGPRKPEPKPDIVAEIINVEGLPQDYDKVAKTIGLKSPAMFAYKFRRILQREEICVYPNPKVEAFLGWAARQERAKGNYVEWVWRPLRERDQVEVNSFSRGDGRIESGVYKKEMPLAALKIVQKVEDALPRRVLFARNPMKVSFFVSDYAAPKPDPFLMALGPDGSRWVLYHWDEPNFVM